MAASVVLARRLSPLATRLGEGGTWDYLTVLAALGSVDLTTARVVEPHLDALAILHQAGMSPREVESLLALRVGARAGRPDRRGPDDPGSTVGATPSDDANRAVAPEGSGGTWGVYAAESPGTTLAAIGSDDAGWSLRGVKPWCSLGDRITHAVVTAGTPDGQRRAFAVRLDDRVRAQEGDDAWISRGLAAVRSTPLSFDDAPAVPVGGPGWYVSRPGFAWGGVGVAAVWYGAAVALADALRAAARARTPDQVALAAIGSLDADLHATAVTLQDAAAGIDAGEAEGQSGALLAARVRAVAARAAEGSLNIVGQALGAGPLCLDEEHARRVADLTVYVRQHHASRDHARLGQLLLDGDTTGDTRDGTVPPTPARA